MDLMLFNEVQRLANRLAEMDKRLEQIARKVGLHHKGCQCPDCRSIIGRGKHFHGDIVRNQEALDSLGLGYKVGDVMVEKK